MAIKAVFFDIDGTLVSFKTHRIPASTVDAITKVKQKGLKIFISTGRPFSFVTNLKEIDHLIDGYISFNGALAHVGDKIIFIKELPKEDIKIMMEDAVKHDYTLAVCGKDKVAIHNYKPIFTDLFVEGLGVDSVDINDSVAPLLNGPVLQMSPFFTKQEEERIMPRLSGSTSLRWHPQFTDISPLGINKGTTLPLVAKHFGIDISECICFGDGGNDKGMLEVAGVGVAMGNANDDVKALADYVTTSVDDNGIANAFKHFKLID